MCPGPPPEAAPAPSVLPVQAGEPLGLIAAGGDLPRVVAASAEGAGFRPVVAKFADALGSDWRGREARDFRWGQAGDAIAWFRQLGVRRVVSCGTVTVRPDFLAIRPSWSTLRLVPQALRIVRGGDDSVLRRTARFLEREGFELLAVQELAPQLLMPRGLVAGRAPGEAERAALSRAVAAARAIGAIDAGQAVVASQERVVAMEGIEGTREMLGRVADLRRRGRLGRRESCILVKTVKPGQDRRFDLPSIGAATIAEAAAAGLAGIGLSAGAGLIIGFEAVVAAAESAGLFVLGLDEDGMGSLP